MTLKAKLNSLEGVDESIQSFYEERDGEFHLLVDGLEDTGALKRAKDHEKQARQAAETQAREAQEQLDALKEQLKQGNDDKARQSGDVEALEKSWSEKLTARETELNGKIESQDQFIKNLLVDGEAARLGGELAAEGSANPLSRLIKDRLGVGERDGKPVTIVLDNQGKPSALTVDELKAELKNDPALAGLIAGSQASGGGAGGSGNGGGASKIDFSNASPAEKVAYLKAKRGD